MRTPTPVPALPLVSITPIKKETIDAAEKAFESNNIVGASRQIAPFPENSAEVKTGWFLVQSTIWESTSVPVWHSPPADTSSTDRLNANLWPNPIRIDPTHARNKCPQVRPASCPLLNPPPQPPPSTARSALPTVDIDNFFYVPVCTCDDAAAISMPLDYIQGAYPGDYMVLMALHLTTKEIADWTWSTFWWSDRPNDQGDFSKNRPPGFPAPWNNYVMDTTLDMVTPLGPQGQIKAIYNPWLEVSSLPLNYAVTSNCMTCHRASTYPVSDIPKPGLLDPAGPDLRNKMKLDFLWSIATQFQ